jgi:hypothetical protein
MKASSGKLAIYQLTNSLGLMILDQFGNNYVTMSLPINIHDMSESLLGLFRLLPSWKLAMCILLSTALST